jgi:hypothetical protein
MRTFACSAAALAAVAVSGCLPASTSEGDASTSNDTSMTSDAASAVTYTKDVQPIFMAKCAPCHTTDGQGGHNIATTYADALKLVNTTDAPSGCFKDGDAKTMPKTIGECTLPAIMEGWMPMAMGCFNTPRPDTCVTTAQQDVVAAWVAAGMPQ